MIDREKLIKQIMAEYEKDGEPITYKEAFEVANMEIKAKQNCRRYETSLKKPTEKKKEGKPKELDTEKVAIIAYVAKQLANFSSNGQSAKNISISNPQREVTFVFNDNDYSLVLTKHRKKKG